MLRDVDKEINCCRVFTEIFFIYYLDKVYFLVFFLDVSDRYYNIEVVLSTISDFFTI